MAKKKQAAKDPEPEEQAEEVNPATDPEKTAEERLEALTEQQKESQEQ